MFIETYKMRLAGVALDRGMSFKVEHSSSLFQASLGCPGGRVLVRLDYQGAPTVSVRLTPMNDVETIRARVGLPVEMLLVLQAVVSILAPGEEVLAQ